MVMRMMRWISIALPHLPVQESSKRFTIRSNNNFCSNIHSK